MALPQRRGRAGEEAAARHLAERGWIILDRNWRAGHRELDLVIRRGPVVAFVEVKTRLGAAFGHPLDAITRRKRREVEEAAREWLRARGPECGNPPEVRFDAVAVHLAPGRAPTVEHIPDAWRPGGG